MRLTSQQGPGGGASFRSIDPQRAPPPPLQLRAPGGGKPGVGGTRVYTCRVNLPSPGLRLSLTPLPRPRVQTLALLPRPCWVSPCRCLGRMKPGCVTLGHLLPLSGYRSFKWGGLLEAKPQARVEEFDPPRGSCATSLPWLGFRQDREFSGLYPV